MNKDLEALADQVIADHDVRVDVPTDIPIRRNPFRHRERPNTAVIEPFIQAFKRSARPSR
jgi:hypothetical protein